MVRPPNNLILSVLESSESMQLSINELKPPKPTTGSHGSVWFQPFIFCKQSFLSHNFLDRKGLEECTENVIVDIYDSKYVSITEC